MSKYDKMTREELLGKVARYVRRGTDNLSPNENDDLRRCEVELRSRSGAYDDDFAERGASRAAGPKAWANDGATEGRTGEILAPSQSMSQWLVKRGKTSTGRAVAHDIDRDAYWSQRLGMSPAGLEMRALGEDTSSGAGAGSAIVPEEWSSTFIDIIRPQLLISKSGASTMPMETEQFSLPQYVSDVQPQWLAENAQMAADGNPQFAPLLFNSVGAVTDLTLFSRQLLEDTNQSGGLSALLEDTISKKYARVLDQIAIYGVTGAPANANPGLNAESGLIVQTMGANGAAPTDPNFLSTAAEAVRNANEEPTALLSNPKVYGTVERLNASTYAKYWDLPRSVRDIPWHYSTALSSAETLGTGTALSSLYMGPWHRMIMGVRVALRCDILRERYADFNQVAIRSYLRVSIRTSHPETFVRVEGITTT